VTEESEQSESPVPADDATPEPVVTEPAAAPDAVAEPEPQPEPAAAPDAVAEPTAAEAAEPAPASEPGSEAAPVPEPAPEPRPRVATWPFVAYVGAWIAFAAILVWRLTQIPDGLAAFEVAEYRYMVMAGLALAVCGPALSLLVWIASWDASDDHGALFVSAAVKGSLATFAGVSLWWLALVVVDQARLGRIL